MKTARRVCPLRAASGRCLHLYPEATSAIRAVPSSKDAGMPTSLSSRLRWWPDHGFTVRFLSSLCHSGYVPSPGMATVYCRGLFPARGQPTLMLRSMRNLALLPKAHLRDKVTIRSSVEGTGTPDG